MCADVRVRMLMIGIGCCGRYEFMFGCRILDASWEWVLF